MTIKSQSIFRDILFTILSLGLWNFYIQMRQIWDVNEMIGRNEIASFTKVVILTVLTFGLYFSYHEYLMTKKLHIMVYGVEKTEIEILFGVITFLGIWVVVDAYQQDLLNQLVEKNELLPIS
jgi:hypothetical protein